jgi:hypothetical protein
MKTKMLLLAALVSAAAMSANAGVRFGFSIGLPLPVLVTTPVVSEPATVLGAIPGCPGADYVWVPGYWSYRPTGCFWIPGAWNHRPVRMDHDEFHHGSPDRDHFDRDDHPHAGRR